MRCALESEAVRLLRATHGERWPDAVLAPVRAAVADLARQRDDDWPAVAAAHAAVHRSLVAAAGSPRITDAHDRLDAELLLVLVHVRPAYSVTGLVAEHATYVESVQRDGGGAVRAHLEHSTGIVLGARRAAGSGEHEA
nr:FCD domain-containing protein [Nocardioides flavescens]